MLSSLQIKAQLLVATLAAVITNVQLLPSNHLWITDCMAISMRTTPIIDQSIKKSLHCALQKFFWPGQLHFLL